MSLREPSQNVSNQPSSDNSARKRPVSERRIQANRRNALRSTGPKTARGKRTVARNAIKHGLLAREVVITAGEGQENLEEFHSLIEGLWKCYEPCGFVEEMLVQTIATCYWRKARVLRAENGEIRKRLDTVGADLALRDSDNCNFGLAFIGMGLGLYNAKNQGDGKVSTRERWSALQVAQSNVRGHHSGLAYLRVLLQLAKSEIASEGHMSKPTANKFFLAFYFWDWSFTTACLNAGSPEAQVRGELPDSSEDKQADKEEWLTVAFMDRQLERIKVLEGYERERAELEGDAEARSFSLPPADAADKLLRYEAHMDRQLYRAMDYLERLQRRRRGENVPPPLNINLGKKG